MKKRITMVFHCQKVEGLLGYPLELGANPPMTMEGMEKIHRLLPALNENGPYDGGVIYCSRLARALDTASILGLHYNMDIQTMKELGQNGNLDGNNVIMYPGCEGESYSHWQSIGVAALRKIAQSKWTFSLAVSHRPVIGGIVAFTKGITDKNGIAAVVGDKTLTAKGYVVFEVEELGGKITMVS